MKVHELIKMLGQYPSATEVMMAIDEEGNDFHPVSVIQKEFLRTDYDEVVPADDKDYVADLRKEHIELIPVVVLWP
jgi:hypothetical protein